MSVAGRAMLVAFALALAVFGAPAAQAATPTIDGDGQACVANSGFVLYSSVAVGIGRTRVSTWTDGAETWVCLESLALTARAILPGTGLRWDTDDEACMANSGTLLYSSTAAFIGRTRLSMWSSPSETWVCFESRPTYTGRIIIPAP